MIDHPQIGLSGTCTKLAEEGRPGIPLLAQGHSFGSIVTLFGLLDEPGRYRAAIISGAPLIAIPELLDADTSLDLDLSWLSADPFYLDSLENDPLAFVDAAGARHDILNEAEHRDVAAAITGFVAAQVGRALSTAVMHTVDESHRCNSAEQ